MDVKTVQSPISLPSMTSVVTPYGSTFNFPRLTVPRDLQIPLSSQSTNVNVKVIYYIFYLF